MEAKITKTIVDNNGNERKIGDKVVFYLLRNDKCYNCLGTITDITEKTFTIAGVELDYMYLNAELVIKYEEVEDGNLYFPRYS